MCDCIRLTNAALKPTNEMLVTGWVISEGAYVERTYIGTTPLERRRGQRDRKMICTYCPFCGVKYDDQPAPPTARESAEGG